MCFPLTVSHWASSLCQYCRFGVGVGRAEERQPTLPSLEKQHSALFGDTEEIHHLKGAGRRYHLSKCAMA